MADFTEFFPDNGAAAPPEQPPASTGPSDSDLLRQQLQFQNHLLQQVIQPQQRQDPPQREQPQAPPQWTDKQWIGDDDARMILDAPATELPSRLNRVVNTAVKEVHDTLSSQIRQREEAESRLQADINARFQQQDAQRTSEFWNNTFYTAHDDLRQDRDLVQAATMMVAEQIRSEPWRAQSAENTLRTIADTARGLRQQKFERWGGTPPSQANQGRAPTSAGRRAAVEGGGSTRLGVAREPDQNAQKSALHEMIQYVRGGR